MPLKSSRKTAICCKMMILSNGWLLLCDKIRGAYFLCGGVRFFAAIRKKSSRFRVNCAILTMSAPARLAEFFYSRGQKHRYAYVEQQQ